MPATAPALRGVHPRKAFPPPVPRPSLAMWPDLAALQNDDLAWALFFVCRRVQDVATAPRGSLKPWKRADDVRGAATGAPEIASELRMLADELGSGLPSRSAIGKACHRIAYWAADCGRGEVAVQFAEAAMAVQPNSPRRIFEAARLNRRFGHLMEAELLYGRAIHFARASGRWEIYVRAHLGLGQVCKTSGRRLAAAAHFRTAASAAWKLTGEKWLAGMTQHDLLVLTAEDGEISAAFGHAIKASALMPKHNERLPILVHDYCVLLNSMHAYKFALPLLELVVQKELPSTDRVIVWSTLGRAAAGVYDHARYRIAEREVTRLRSECEIRAAAAHANLAIGAYALGLLAECHGHAQDAIEIATTRGEYGIRSDIEALIDAVANGAAGPIRAAVDDIPEPMHEFGRELCGRLRSWRGSTWRRKSQAGLARLGRV